MQVDRYYMTSNELITFYQERRTRFASALSKVKKQINFVSNLRIGVALLFLASCYLALSNAVAALVAIALLIVFIMLVVRHSFLFDQKTHLENLVKINQLEEHALRGKISEFPNGAEFIDPHHSYSHDLDIFGDGSLFQAVNRCNTNHGKTLMAQRLGYPLLSADEVYRYQASIQELSIKTEFRQHFQASGMEIAEQPRDRVQLLQWLKQPLMFYSIPYYNILLVALPLSTIIAVVAAFFISQVKLIAILLVLSQWLIVGYHSKRIAAFHEGISQKKNILEKYARLLHYFSKETFNASTLTNLASRALEADKKVGSLATLVSYLNARLNFLTNVVVNSFLLYDIQCIYRLEKWKSQNAPRLEVWLDVISETEVLCSLGNFSFNHSAFVYPKINSELLMSGVGMGHPLISPNECVPNDLFLGKGQSVLIITGANMAGKSTFLRTTGVNVVLALAGAPVFAKAFSCPIINLRSGMRTADSLKDHQSYFYAELDRLKTIMDELRSDKPLLVLLDEILKGTNSADKQSGSIALVRQLLPHPCLALIATHDTVLGELEHQFPDNIKNYYFEANIENDQLSFDYKLKRGVAQKMNATFLMKKMGIIPSA